LNVASVGSTPPSTTDTAPASGTGELADLFANLVGTMLAGQDDDAASSGDDQAPVADPETATADAATAASLAFLVGVFPVQAPVALAVQAQLVPQEQTQVQATATAAGAGATTTGEDSPAGLGAAVEQLPIAAPPTGVAPTATGATPAPTAAPAPAPAEGQTPAAGQMPADAPTTEATTGTVPVDAATPREDVTAPVTSTMFSTPAPTTTPAVTAPAAAAGPAPAPESTAMVTTQVFDAISKLVARPDGSHRVTLKLNPAELGEVEIIMTTRHGSVRVELHGSDEATAALRSGTHELFRLLEATPGTTSTHISVRETTGSSATSYQGTDQGRSGDAQRQAAAQDQENLSAGKRTGSKDPATDGPFAPRAVSSGGRIDQDGTSLTNGFDVTV
jgi:flagellar hook-length control protein FliK